MVIGMPVRIQGRLITRFRFGVRSVQINPTLTAATAFVVQIPARVLLQMRPDDAYPAGLPVFQLNIQPAVMVEIRKGHCQCLSHGIPGDGISNLDPGCCADILELPVPQVPEQRAECPLVQLWRPVGSIRPVDGEMQLKITIPGPLHVVTDEQVKVAVTSMDEMTQQNAALIEEATEGEWAEF